MVYHAKPARIPMGTLFSTPSESNFMLSFSGHLPERYKCPGWGINEVSCTKNIGPSRKRRAYGENSRICIL